MNLHLPRTPLDAAKFRDPAVTAKGEARASVALERLETLWFNTGTLCNIECGRCYIESSPLNDRLAYLFAAEVETYLDEIAALGWTTREIGFTGGEPFLNREFIAMLEACLARGFAVLVLTNAMKPMELKQRELLGLHRRYGARLTLRVSLDHYAAPIHDAERGQGSFAKTIEGIDWAARHGFRLALAGRHFSGESEADLRGGYARLIAEHAWPIEARDPSQLVIFPEMDASGDVPEITTACWGILGKSPSDVMCASSRMVVKRKGSAHPAVLSCTLLPYDSQFELGRSLAESNRPVALNHPHCAKFCVLGGASCSAK
ncbi:MAG TPA: radical SAM protein [Rhizomicrobium sp.]